MKHSHFLPLGFLSQRQLIRAGFFVLSCILVTTNFVWANGQEEQISLPESFDKPIPLYSSSLGKFTRTISSSHDKTQQYFNQGFQLMYAFAKLDAARSFREAQQHDPTCAICYWGEAWAWGSYLNGPMRPDEAPHAYAAIQKALGLSEQFASEKEKDFIQSLSVRYIKDFEPDQRKIQDMAYAEAMENVAKKYPEDLDAITLYAEALFLLEPRRGYRDLQDPDVKRLHETLESVLAVDIRHPGACHLYIHATESTVKPEKAEPCAEYLGNAIPGASHINHMPSHTWNEIGRWGDSVRANLLAWHSDQKASLGDGFAIYPSHNLHMLLFAASMDGQGAISIQAGKDYEKLTGDSLYHALTLIRFGRFDEVRDVNKTPDKEISSGLWDFAQGYANLRQGNIDFAKVYLGRVRQMANSSTQRLRFHSAASILSIVAGILEGEIYRQSGNYVHSVRAFREAVTVEDTLMYDEPEPLPFAARHWLGAALLEAKRYEEAEQVYRDDLKDHPNNGWSLFGLKKALEAQGQSSSLIDAEFNKNWSRADIWLKASRF